MKLRRTRMERRFNAVTLREHWQSNWEELLCAVLGHKKPYQRKFGGDELCARCSRQVGRWS